MNFAMAIEIKRLQLCCFPQSANHRRTVCQRGDSRNARPVSRVCTSGAGDGFEDITTSSWIILIVVKSRFHKFADSRQAGSNGVTGITFANSDERQIFKRDRGSTPPDHLTAPISEIVFDVLKRSPVKKLLGCLCRSFGIRLASQSGWVQR
jgi:hypothetical protein